MFNSSVGGRKLFEKKNKKKNWKIWKISKKKFTCFLFSTVTIYRLYHTHSLGSVEPTIALSESLWSRIVTQNKKKKKINQKNQKNQKFQKKRKKKKKKYLLVFVLVFVFVVLFLWFPTPMMRLNLIVRDESMFRSPELHFSKLIAMGLCMYTFIVKLMHWTVRSIERLVWTIYAILWVLSLMEVHFSS